MADAPDSKSGAFTGVWVQVPSPVPIRSRWVCCSRPRWGRRFLPRAHRARLQWNRRPVDAERWRSGRSRPLGKRVYPTRVPRVRIPPSPPFPYAPISGDDSPQAGKLDVQNGVTFRAERVKDFVGRNERGHILRQDRDKRGLGIGDERKRSVLQGIFGIRAGQACGRAAARRGDRWGEIFRTALRTASVRRQGRLRRSAFVRQIQTRKHKVPTDFFVEIPQSFGSLRLRIILCLPRCLYEIHQWF